VYLLVGLGNPELEYGNTRHNMGFHVINKIAEEYNIEINKSKFKGLFGDGLIENQKVILLKPQTFMNLSGESVIEIKNFYKLDLEKIIVVYDDIDIEPGKIRIRKNGSPGTHNGMKSVVHYLLSEDFVRVRVGIGKPNENTDLISHVIGDIPEEEKELLLTGVNKAKNAIVEIIKNGLDSAMNLYN